MGWGCNGCGGVVDWNLLAPSFGLLRTPHFSNFVVFDAKGAVEMFLVVCWLWMPLVKKKTMHWCKILGKNIWLQLHPMYEWHLEYYHMYAYDGSASSLEVH
jgi:hypothetical protein